jgi:hypothetical protein
VDDRRIDDRALAHEQPPAGKDGVDLRQHGPRQVVGFEQVPELGQGSRVRHGRAVQIDPGEEAQSRHVVERIFECLIGQRVPLL